MEGEGDARGIDGKSLVRRLITDRLINKNTTIAMIQKGSLKGGCGLFWDVSSTLEMCLDGYFDDLEFWFSPFWVQFHDLPLEGMCKENVVTMGAKVDEILVIENPILNGFWVPRPNLPSIWVSVKFEKLNQFCYKCGVLGHDSKMCRNWECAKTKDEKPLYGAWVGVAPVRVWEDAVIVCKEGWNLLEEWKLKTEHAPHQEGEPRGDDRGKSND
ncbi:TMV resistance protein N-like [Senna tora]|uniref:TMV resistance protein N-like n=1 Tax=Senna tora TaxID=362788 RepID=A0A834TL15_9FABA|nr:TMV resistance protein N-like [Senna tora]